eukprot:771080-Rhodomonas_salina.7
MSGRISKSTYGFLWRTNSDFHLKRNSSESEIRGSSLLLPPPKSANEPFKRVHGAYHVHHDT